MHSKVDLVVLNQKWDYRVKLEYCCSTVIDDPTFAPGSPSSPAAPGSPGGPLKTKKTFCTLYWMAFCSNVDNNFC